MQLQPFRDSETSRMATLARTPLLRVVLVIIPSRCTTRSSMRTMLPYQRQVPRDSALVSPDLVSLACRLRYLATSMPIKDVDSPIRRYNSFWALCCKASNLGKPIFSAGEKWPVQTAVNLRAERQAKECKPASYAQSLVRDGQRKTESLYRSN